VQNSMTYFQRFRNFVIALSGAHAETLKLVPSERPRFESLGWSILITSGLAAVSMWFALATTLSVNGIAAVPISLLWGLVIMGIDRWLVTSMPIDSNRKFALAAPRVVLALLLGTLISTPLVLRIFQTEINAQIATMQQSNYSAFLKQQQGSQVAQQVSTYSNELQYLDKVISSKGAVTPNTSSDPQIVTYNKQLTSLQSQLATWSQTESQALKEYSCQKYGGADCPKAGIGPVAKASLASYNQAKGQVSKIQGEINQVQQEIKARDTVLTSTTAAAAQIRLQQAVAQQPVVENEYQTAVQRQNQLQASFYAQNQASHGLLTRLEALSELSDSNMTVAIARLLLFLLFLVIECLPVTVKLLQRSGHYEEALARAKEAEKRDVEEYYRDGDSSGMGVGYGVPAFAPPAPAANPAVAEPAPVRSEPLEETRRERRERQAAERQAEEAERQAEDERVAAEVSSVWNPTREMPRVVGDPADDVRTEELDRSARTGAEQQAFTQAEHYASPFDFPPSESDPRAAASAAARSADDWGQASEPDWASPSGRTRRDDAAEWSRQMEHIGAVWTKQDSQVPETRMDSAYPADERSGHTSQPEASQADNAQARREQDTSFYDSLTDIDDDDRYSAHGESGAGGMPLNWDDE
jgi:hypothetical protein